MCLTFVRSLMKDESWVVQQPGAAAVCKRQADAADLKELPYFAAEALPRLQQLGLRAAITRQGTIAL
jgi:hypothetical protein